MPGQAGRGVVVGGRSIRELLAVEKIKRLPVTRTARELRAFDIGAAAMADMTRHVFAELISQAEFGALADAMMEPGSQGSTREEAACAMDRLQAQVEAARAGVEAPSANRLGSILLSLFSLGRSLGMRPADLLSGARSAISPQPAQVVNREDGGEIC